MGRENDNRVFRRDFLHRFTIAPSRRLVLRLPTLQLGGRCMLDEWLQMIEDRRSERKTLFTLTEQDGGRDAVSERLIDRIRCHYDDLQNIADDIERLGFPGAARIFQQRLPTRAGARSGELGEILAVEFVEFQTSFRIPVRRMRYKDQRELALRGDDFLGIYTDDENQLLYLKGEAKSGQGIYNAVVTEARDRLKQDEGRPTPISILFVTDRLLEGDEDDKDIGRRIRDAFAHNTIAARTITHGLFTLSGNWPQATLEADLDAADGGHHHISANLRIVDHQDFIEAMYEQAGEFGND